MVDHLHPDGVLDPGQSWRVRQPWLVAIGFALVPLMVIVTYSATAMVRELNMVATRLQTTAAMAALFALGLMVMGRAPLALPDFGWRQPQHLKEVLWLAPIAVSIGLVLLILIIDGTDASPAAIGLGALLAVFVGLAEETWYRGLVLRVLLPRGRTVAVFGSAMLFSVMHSAGLLGGAALVPTLLQVVFAMLFGVVTALVTLRTGSLRPAIAWHAIHNTLSFPSRDEPTTAFVVGYGLIGLLLVGYAYWLFIEGAGDRRPKISGAPSPASEQNRPQY